jgi:DNA repair protein RadA/Sms
MVKKSTIFVCNNCGYESVRWLGRCPSCQEWNSLQEFKVPGGSLEPGRSAARSLEPVPITQVDTAREPRLATAIGELDRVLGGGIIPGSLVLIGGEPGIGKSTLLMQAARALADSGANVLYITGEESMQQVSLRAARLKALHPSIFLLAEHSLENIEEAIRSFAPPVVIVDSIQTLFSDGLTSSPGTVSQIRECTARLMRLAKSSACSIFLVGHVTKDGALAGPKTLEHMVDCVLYFEGDRHHIFRLLRCVKNRFGSTNEIGVFLMTAVGLEEVSNPSQLFLSQGDGNQPGSVVTATMEGSRPLLVEIQALVATSGFGNPRRMADGLDNNRLALLLAVLEKRGGLHLQGLDVYVNVVGGVRIDEPAADLAAVLAAASAFRDKQLPRGLLAIGEVGLTGELRAVSRLEHRLKEAAKLGFGAAIVPAMSKLEAPSSLTVYPASGIEEALHIAFGGGDNIRNQTAE